MISIRPAAAGDATAIARVHVTAWHAALDAYVPAVMREAVDLERYDAMWQSLLGPHAAIHTTLVATEDGGAVVGFATAGQETASIPGFDCELHTLYVAPKFQRRNIGCRLFHDLSGRMRGAGCGSMAATAIDTPQARGFFRTMGGNLAASQPVAPPLGAALAAPFALAADEPEPVMDLFTWHALVPQQTETET